MAMRCKSRDLRAHLWLAVMIELAQGLPSVTRHQPFSARHAQQPQAPIPYFV